MTKQIKILGTACCRASLELNKLVAKKIQELNADVVIAKLDTI